MRDPRCYHIVLLDGTHKVNGKAVAVVADHQAGCIQVARGAPVADIVKGLSTALHDAYGRAGVRLVPVVGKA
jgi:hypothetical protein